MTNATYSRPSSTTKAVTLWRYAKTKRSGFGRRETTDDKQVITCAIPRTACVYDEEGVLSEPCEADQRLALAVRPAAATVAVAAAAWSTLHQHHTRGEQENTMLQYYCLDYTAIPVSTCATGIRQ